MGDPAMALGEVELVRIGDYVKGNLRSWLQEVAPTVFTPDPISHSQLLERITRLDERFEHVDDRFEAIDKRFDDLIHHMDKRFEAVDKRFEDQIQSVDKRFEAMDRRFTEQMQTTRDGFEHLGKRISTVRWTVIVGLAAAAIAATLLAGFFR